MNDRMTYEGSWQQEVESLRAEVERLGGLVKEAFYEGVETGWSAAPDNTKSTGEDWADSIARRALDGEEVSDE